MNAVAEMPSPLVFSDSAANKVKQLIEEEGSESNVFVGILNLLTSRGNPANASGSRPREYDAASIRASAMRFDSSRNPVRAMPAAMIALSCGHTLPQWYEMGL